MIPRTIHFCWFGGKEKPKLAEKCIASWKKYCPDYEYVEWNEGNFDVSCCPYVKEAYDCKRYAFVTDYVRLYAMYTQGGIYMDTDVELIRSLEPFLHHQGFSGFESETHIPTGIMAGEKNFPLFKKLLDDYEGRHFVDLNGKQDTTTNVVTITKLLTEEGFVPNGQFQVVEGFALYPRDYFCPFEDSTGKMFDSKNTVAIHWFNKSWVPQHLRIRSRMTRVFHRCFGVDSLAFLRKK